MSSGTARSPVIVIAGPTGAGKSRIAVALVERLPELRMEIISADSRQVYRGMTIGTDKPSMALRSRVPHHLVDVLNPDEPFSAADFRRMALPIIRNLHAGGKLPLIVGGTGLYIRALLRGLAPVPGAEPGIREALQRRLEEEGVGALYAHLMESDPERARQIHPRDTYRIIRALEIIQSGASISDSFKRHAFSREEFRTLYCVMSLPRDALYEKIDKRVDAMLEQGFVEEVRRLRERFGRDAFAFNAIGYRQILQYIEGRLRFDEAVRLIKRDTRRFAKRQVTWFRKEPGARWIEGDFNARLDTLVNLVRKFMEKENEFENTP